MLLLDEVRLTSDALRYGFAVGKVRVLETRALDGAAIERLLDAPTFAEQKRLLSESPFGRFLENAETAEDVERGLTAALESFYSFLGTAELPQAVTHFFLLRYDFANLKAAAKARLLSVAIDDLLVEHGTVPREAFTGDLTELPEPFSSVAADLPLEAVKADGQVTDAESLAIDTSIDKAMFAELLATAERARSGYLVDLAQLGIDAANVRVLVRARLAGMDPTATTTLLIPGGTTPVEELATLTDLAPGELATAVGRMPSLRGIDGAELERPESLDLALDDVVLAARRRGRMGGQVGPEPVISYVLAREVEVATLRVLLLGRLAGIDNNKLRARVRVCV